MPPQKSRSPAGQGHTSCLTPSIPAWSGSSEGRLQTLCGGGSCCHRLCQGEARKDACNRDLRSAYDAVSSAVVERRLSPSTRWPLVKMTWPKKPSCSYGASGSMIGRFGPCDHSPGFVKIKQQSAQTVAIFLGRAVINLQPTLGSSGSVPLPRQPVRYPSTPPALGQATVPAPVNQGRATRPAKCSCRPIPGCWAGAARSTCHRSALRRERSLCCAEERSCPRGTKSFQLRVVLNPTPTPLLETCV